MRALRIFALALSLALPAAAQTAIQDNSFLIEEAYNQEDGVVQHIQTFTRGAHGGPWLYTFTEEWPVTGLRHQLSYTLTLQDRVVGDTAVNYRYQLVGDGDARVAFSPRVTVLVPAGRGGGKRGWQVMLPASTVLSPSIVAHWNLGAGDGNVLTAGQSVVWLIHPRFNALVETLWSRVGHDTQTTVNPGIRWSYDLPRHVQIVPGISIPIANHHGGRAVLLYLSIEHPFRTRSES